MEYKISELIYNLPYINGQYYIADNGNNRIDVYDIHEHLGYNDIHEHLGYKIINNNIIQKFGIIKNNIEKLNKKINYNFNFDMHTNKFDEEFHNFSLFFNEQKIKENKELFNELQKENHVIGV